MSPDTFGNIALVVFIIALMFTNDWSNWKV